MTCSRLIYGLCDPRTGELRYVGKTEVGLTKRLKGHNYYRKSLKDHCHRWICVLWDVGLRPDAFVIEENPADLDDAETFWIQYFRSIGAKLTNTAAGGEGCKAGPGHPSYGKKLSAEHRAKIAAANRGKKLTAETRRKISDANQGVGRPRKPFKTWRKHAEVE